MSALHKDEIVALPANDQPVVMQEFPDPAMVDVIVKLMAQYKKVEADGWTAETKLEQLEIDSFDFVEFVFLIEDELNIEIKFNANDTAKRLATIGDIALEVGKQVKARDAK